MPLRTRDFESLSGHFPPLTPLPQGVPLPLTIPVLGTKLKYDRIPGHPRRYLPGSVPAVYRE